MKKLELDREMWLTEAAQFVLDNIIHPQMPKSWNPPTPYRVSLGYPPRARADSKVVAVCIKSEASADGTSEIFVSPKSSNSLELLGHLTHELVHYSDDCASGHKHHFAKLARNIGLEGKLTATKPGVKLEASLEKIIKILGEIPHAAIDLGKAKAKQTTRMIKVACPAPLDQCGFSYRASMTNIHKITDFLCPACAIEDMSADL